MVTPSWDPGFANEAVYLHSVTADTLKPALLYGEVKFARRAQA